jgi:hypothetical protein
MNNISNRAASAAILLSTRPKREFTIYSLPIRV